MNNQAVWLIVDTAVYGAVDRAVYRAVYVAVAERGAVYWAVAERGVVNVAVADAVADAVDEEPPHAAIELYLRGVA
jgi:hypothetical protein